MKTLFPSGLFQSPIVHSVALFGDTNPDALSDFTRDRGYESLVVAMVSGTLHIALRGFKIMNPPRPAKSPGSNAVYLASGINKQDGLLLQYLPANSTTSWHYHAETTERFHLLSGSAVVSTPWGFDLDFVDNCSVTVKPFTVHQVKIGPDQDALILLEMVFTSEDVGMKDHFYVDPGESLDIHSKSGYPASALSNFYSYPFTIDGVECASMEGFLQSLKERDPDEQRRICKLTGKPAKERGNALSASRTVGDPVYWLGMTFDRCSDDFQVLLDRAYQALADVPKFQAALLASSDRLLVHTIGKKQPQTTILTELELCSRLMRLRHFLRR